MSQDRDHDDHCHIVWDGVDWMIGQIIHRGDTLCLWHGPGAIDQEFALLDVSGVDWASYCTAAVRMLEAQNLLGSESVKNFGNRRHFGIVLEG
jgi:hypothetical protein